MSIEYITILVYFIFLVSLGFIVAKMNSTVDDYVRGGAKGTWWIVGSSMFVGGISAFTFTGNASAAFSAGPTFLVIYAANTVGFLLCMILGPWFRQTRAETWADVLHDRYGVPVEQFSAIIGVIMSPLAAGIQLYALAVFAASALDLPVVLLIFILGGIAITYSTMGGRWGVMATDFIQGVLMFAMTLLVFYLSLKAVGGWEKFIGYFSDPRFANDFKFVKDAGEFHQGKYSLKWIIVIFFMQVSGYINLGTAGRFLSVKDGPSARKASLLAAVLMFVGSVIWFVPPMVARFLFEADVNALGVKEPATASYSYIAQSLLPNGLMGLMLAAMFAATMSSLDSSLNGMTGVIVKNIMPWARSKMGMTELTSKQGVRWCQFATLALGAAIIAVACVFASQDKLELFDAFLMISAVIGVPLGLPVLLGLWIKRIYWGSYFVIIGVALLPSVYFTYDSSVNGASWSIQDRMIWLYAFGVIGFIIGYPMWRFAKQSERTRINEFFKRMHRPVDFAKEIGEENDAVQLKLLGVSSLAMSGFVCLLLFVPNEFAARMQILALAAFMAIIGAALLVGYVRKSKAIKPANATDGAQLKEANATSANNC
ncbi:sodium:solute symporter family protein [Cerasicoccus maritimus]|uniref:sodium:solute symporter family protein n=1 Tax=Cerasicoccus maritimus TaxID=490089 RepID=UPI00285267D8|nr:hypothetical protein [Cerasicoccus maritimus]